MPREYGCGWDGIFSLTFVENFTTVSNDIILSITAHNKFISSFSFTLSVQRCFGSPGSWFPKELPGIVHQKRRILVIIWYIKKWDWFEINLSTSKNRNNFKQNTFWCSLLHISAFFGLNVSLQLNSALMTIFWPTCRSSPCSVGINFFPLMIYKHFLDKRIGICSFLHISLLVQTHFYTEPQKNLIFSSMFPESWYHFISLFSHYACDFEAWPKLLVVTQARTCTTLAHT